MCVGRPNLVFLSPLETMSFLIVPMDPHGLLLFLSLGNGIMCVGRPNLVFLSPLETMSFLTVPMDLHGLLLFLSLVH